MPFPPAVSLLGIYPMELIRDTTNFQTKILITALFITAKDWKQPTF